MSSGARVSIPNNVRKTIQTIKEITGNHSEEDVYAMLKECSMDPNETAQKLLLQDTFHEVKRKRDRRKEPKENLSNKESVESRWRPGMQGRGSRGGRVNYSPHSILKDASGGRNFASGKKNGINQVSEKDGGLSSLPTLQETKNKNITPATSSLTVLSNGPTALAPGSTGLVHAAHLSAVSSVNQSEEGSSVDVKLGGPPPVPPLADVKGDPSIEFGTGRTNGQLTSTSSNSSTPGAETLSPKVNFSASDPVLVPSRLTESVCAIKREVGSQQTPAEQISIIPSEGESSAASEVGSFSVQGKIPSKSFGIGNNQLSDTKQPAFSSHGGSSVNRLSSSNNSRSQQVTVYQKGPQSTHGSSALRTVGPSKEWKPKPTNLNVAQGSGKAGSSEFRTTAKANTHSDLVSSAVDSKEATSKLRRKLEDLHFPDGQHVIIPNHLLVPEAEKIGFCFGSFDASFGLNTGYKSGSENDRNLTAPSETSESLEDTEEQSSRFSNQNALEITEKGDYPDHPESPRDVPETLSSGEGDISSTTVSIYSDSKQESALPPESHQYSTVHTSPSYNYGFMPPMVGNQFAPFESSESQVRDVPRLPSFVVPQRVDPTSYYAQFYRSGVDSDGRTSPFHSPGVAPKYNAHVAGLLPTSQPAQEGGNSLVLSMAGPTPLATHAAGVMQNSVTVTQQPLPVFRQPTGIPVPHYPSNYISYGHYFSPFYLPPQSVHQFFSNGAFPQQPQAGSIYPAPPGVSAKYSLPQYKGGSNTGNSNHVGGAGSYGPHGTSPASYNPSLATAGNPTANEDLFQHQFKESNAYVTGQQSEGSTLWIAASGRDISGLQASSFYNIPHQGQVAFTPPQGGHGTFSGIYHPAQAVSASSAHPLLQQSQSMAAAVEMAGPTASAYQQPQHTQVNWPSNY